MCEAELSFSARRLPAMCSSSIPSRSAIIEWQLIDVGDGLQSAQRSKIGFALLRFGSLRFLPPFAIFSFFDQMLKFQRNR
jgi:hypothetical protein